MEAVRAMGDPERVHRISTQRMDQRRDLRGIDLSIAGADCMDAVGGQFVAEQRPQFLQGAGSVAGHMDALGVIFPVRAAIFPSFG